MTSAVTGLAITPASVFAYNALLPMTGGMAAPSQAGPDLSPASQAGLPDQQETEVAKPAQLGVQVPDALLSLLVANTPVASAPYNAPSGTSAVGAAYTQAADNDGAGSSTDSSSDWNTSNSGSAPGEAGAGLPELGSTPHKPQRSDTPVHIIPQWHIIPRMKIA